MTRLIVILWVLAGGGFLQVDLFGREDGKRREGPESFANQQVRPKAKRPAKRPVEILNILSEASAAPPEFAADVLIRVARSKKVQDPSWKREMLEEAFRLASKSEHKIKRDYAGEVMDTREGYLSMALALKLDSLSLQSKAVTAMLSVDKQRAREMFSEINPDLKLPALTCEDALIPDVSDFYDALKQVALETFGPEEVRNGTQLWFVQRYVAAMTSPSQVAPLARVIVSLDTTPAQFSVLLTSFSNALKLVSNDYRTFLFSVFRDPPSQVFTELAAACDRKGVPTDDLLKSLRAYIVANFTSAQCADNTVARKKEVPGFIRVANNGILQPFPISLAEIQPSHVEGRVKTYPYWESPKAKEFLTNLKRLRFGSDNRPRTEAEKASSEWHQQLIDYLNNLQSWSASHEQSESDYFHQKAIVYRVLSTEITSGLVRDRLLRSYASFLSESFTHQGRAEWFLHANHLLDQVRTPKGTDRTTLIGILQATPNTVFRTYAHFYQARLD